MSTVSAVDVQVESAAPPWRIPVGLMLVAGALVLLGCELANSAVPAVAVVWGAIALAVYAVGLLCFASPGARIELGIVQWKIGSWLLLWYGVAFGILTVTWSRPQAGVDAEIAVSSVLRALWLVAVGMTAWVIGYLLGPGRLAQGLGERVVAKLQARFAADVRSLIAPWVLYVIGAAASLVTAGTTGRFGYVAQSQVTSATGYAGVLSALSLCAPQGSGVFRDCPFVS